MTWLDKMLLEFRDFNILSEGYEQRVDQVVRAMKKHNKQWSADLVASYILNYAEQLRIVDVRTSGKKEFIKDVTKEMKKQKLIKKKTSQRMPYYVNKDRGFGTVGVSKKEVIMLGYKMQDFAGMTFPDGDPTDFVFRYATKKGWDPYDTMQKLVPAAAKLVLQTKSYEKYLSILWDDFAKDNPDNDMGVKKNNNPWK